MKNGVRNVFSGFVNKGLIVRLAVLISKIIILLLSQLPRMYVFL